MERHCKVELNWSASLRGNVAAKRYKRLKDKILIVLSSGILWGVCPVNKHHLEQQRSPRCVGISAIDKMPAPRTEPGAFISSLIGLSYPAGGMHATFTHGMLDLNTWGNSGSTHTGILNAHARNHKPGTLKTFFGYATLH